MATLTELLTRAAKDGASDLFLVPGGPVSYKLDGVLLPLQQQRLTPNESEAMLLELYALAERSIDSFRETGDDDFSLSIPGLARFRVNAYRQRGSWAAVIRVVAFSIPDWKTLGIPEAVMSLSELTGGMVLVTGTAGCGKSTTLACLMDRINHTRACHIVTLEDPVEYLHRNEKSIVSQREIAVDTGDYLSALRACLRQAPDVIQLGEMRDQEAIRTAMTAAETGHLVIATLHTADAASTIDRIIDVFPAGQQQQIRVQLAMVLQTVISQQLVPDVDGRLIPVFEVMQLNNAVRNMIRESKVHQLDALIASSSGEGMVSMDSSLLDLVRAKRITKETAIHYAANGELMEKRVSAL